MSSTLSISVSNELGNAQHISNFFLYNYFEEGSIVLTYFEVLTGNKLRVQA